MSRFDPHIITRLANTLPANVSLAFRRFMTFTCRHESQELAICSTAPLLIFHGPNICGKTPTAAMRMLIHTTGWVPFSLRGKVNPRPREYRGMPDQYGILGVTHKQARGASWKAVRDWMPPEFVRHPDVVRPSTMQVTTYRFVNNPANKNEPIRVDEDGVSIERFTFETRRKAQQGGAYGYIWQDEDDDNEDVVDEFTTQVFKTGGWFMATMTAVESLKKGGKTWLGEQVLTPAFAARREPRQRLVVLDAGDDSEARTEVVLAYRGDQISARTTDLMTPQDLKRLDSRYSRPSVRRLRVDGEWSVIADRPYYDERTVAEIVAAYHAATPCFRRGDVRALPPAGVVAFRADPDGLLVVFEDPDPEETYVIGADLAGGNAGDWTAFIVWARCRRRIAAAFHAKIEAFRAAPALFDLHRWYNNAWTVIDPDKHGTEAIAFFRAQNALGRVYRRRRRPEDDHQGRGDYGYGYTEATREALDRRVALELDRGFVDLRLWPLIEEIRVYGYYGRRNRAGQDVGDHPPSGHDDLQKAFAQALIGHDQCPMPPRPDPVDLALARANGIQKRILEEQRAMDALLREIGTQQGHPDYVET